MLGAKRQFGDTWKMLKWQFSADTWAAIRNGMRANGAANERAFRVAGTHADASASGEHGFGFLGRTDCGCYDHAGHRSDGFLGSHVARLLAGRGENVRVLVRPSSDLRALGRTCMAERVAGDLRDRASLDRAMQGVDAVFHVAADYRLWARDPREIYESNVTGTRNLLDAARARGCREFVYTSTVATIAVPREAMLCRTKRRNRPSTK